MVSLNNVPAELTDGVRDCLNKTVKLTIKRLMNYETKKGQENRILALSPYRCYIFSTKMPIKLESTFHYLEITEIESKRPKYLVIGTKTRKHNFSSLETEMDEIDHIITHIGTSLKTVFPALPLEHLINKIDVQPSARLKLMHDLMRCIEVKEIGPCGGFSLMYMCMCDLHNVTYKEEVTWDVDTIYLAQDSKELCLRDFDHLKEGDLVPLVSALTYNIWFTSLNADNVKLGPELCTEIIYVLQKNSVIESLLMNNSGVSLDFIKRLAQISLSKTQLHKIDLSNNAIDDIGVEHLFGSQKSCCKRYKYLDLSQTKISTKGLNRMAELMLKNTPIFSSLQTLKLSYLSSAKMDDLSLLYSFLALPNIISYLDLSGTDIELDKLMEPLLQGCSQHILSLHLAKTNFSCKKSKEVVVQDSFKRFFACAVCLQHVNLSGAKLPPDAIKDLLLGIGSNSKIKGMDLNISNIEINDLGAQYLYNCLSAVRNITKLNISGIGFSDEDLLNVLNCVGENKHIKHLSIGRVFTRIRKNWQDVLDQLVYIIQDEDAVIESLSLADSKLKNNTNAIISALSSNKSLTEIDISGNMMENTGARSLAKALQINNKLRTIIWDKNNTSYMGFEDIALALEKNYTLTKMPIPIHDASDAVKQSEKAEEALLKIEALLQRNHSPHKFSSDRAYRLQRGFLISSTQQRVDQLIVQNQDTMYALQKLDASQIHNNDIENTKSLITDASNSKTLLPRLHAIATEAQGNNNPVVRKLKEMSVELTTVLDSHLQMTIHRMLDGAKSQCSTILSDEAFLADVHNGCNEKCTLPEDFTRKILEAVEIEIFNKLSELNLAVVTHVSNTLIETVLDRLSVCHKTLTTQLSEKRQNIKCQSHHLEGNAGDISHKITKSLKSSAVKKGSMHQRMIRPQSVFDETYPKNSSPKGTAVSAARFDEVVKHQILDCPGKNRPKIARRIRPTAKPTELPLSMSPDNLQVDDGLQNFYPDSAQVGSASDDMKSRKDGLNSTLESKKKSNGILVFNKEPKKSSGFPGLFKKSPMSPSSKKFNTPVSDVKEEADICRDEPVRDTSVSCEIESNSVSTSSCNSISSTDNVPRTAVQRLNSELSESSNSSVCTKQNNGIYNVNVPTTVKKPLQLPRNVSVKKQLKKDAPQTSSEEKEQELVCKADEVIVKLNMPIETEEKDNAAKEKLSDTDETADVVAKKTPLKDKNTDEEDDKIYKRTETAGNSQGNNIIETPAAIGGAGLCGIIFAEMMDKQEKRHSLFPSKTNISDTEPPEANKLVFHLKPAADAHYMGLLSKNADGDNPVADVNSKASFPKDKEHDKDHKPLAEVLQLQDVPKSESLLDKPDKKLEVIEDLTSDIGHKTAASNTKLPKDKPDRQLEATKDLTSDIGHKIASSKTKIAKDMVHKHEVPTDKPISVIPKSGLNKPLPNARLKPNIHKLNKPMPAVRKSRSSSENEQKSNDGTTIDVNVKTHHNKMNTADTSDTMESSLKLSKHQYEGDDHGKDVQWDLSLHTSEVTDKGVVLDTEAHLEAHSYSVSKTGSIVSVLDSRLQNTILQSESQLNLKQNGGSNIKPDILEDPNAANKTGDLDNVSTGADNKDVESTDTEVVDKNVC